MSQKSKNNNILVISPTDKRRIKAVIKLASKNKKTLGFLPDAAFFDFTKRNGMIVLENSDGVLLGYALIYTSKEISKIHHFCIDTNLRKSGLGHILMDAIKEHAKRSHGINLWCRDDFPADSMWPKLGFVPLTEKKGRNLQGLPKTYWWYDHNHDSIFTIIERNRSNGKSIAVLDANVFYGIDDDKAPDEDKAILADWLSEYIDFAVTKEIFNEIKRGKDKDKRKRDRSRAQLFSLIKNNEKDFKKDFEELKSIFRDDLSVSDISDIRQLAHVVSCKSKRPDFFVTRDQGDLLIKSKLIEEKYGFKIIRPSDLVLHFDQKQRSTEYTPQKYSGSSLEFKLIGDNSVTELSKIFLCNENGEKVSVFARIVNNALSKPDKVESRSVTNKGSLIGMIVWDKQEPNYLKIPIVRVASKTKDNTLFQHLIYRSVHEAIMSKQLFVVITDSFLPDYFFGILQFYGFVKVGGQWIKSCIPGIYTIGSLQKKIQQLKRRAFVKKNPGFGEYLDRILETLEKMNGINKAGFLEKHLWPTKIYDEQINTFIIPIKPKWAKELFDEELASDDLFGSSQHLILNSENVYYRANRPNPFKNLKGIARILWYESQDKVNKISQIRAVSYVEDVSTGTPKQLFKSYKRLGVYNWNDVFNVAKEDLTKEIMAIRFSSTEMLRNPIGLDDLRNIQKKHYGKHNAIQSPVSITEEMFAEIYHAGMNINVDIPERPRLRLLLSIHHNHVENIFSGKKTYELRKKRPDMKAGDWILVYSTMPVMTISGAVRVKGIMEGSPDNVWLKCGNKTGINKGHFNDYFNGTDIAYAIHIDKYVEFPAPIGLKKLRTLKKDFHPPQGYFYIDSEAGFWWNLIKDQWYFK